MKEKRRVQDAGAGSPSLNHGCIWRKRRGDTHQGGKGCVETSSLEYLESSSCALMGRSSRSRADLNSWGRLGTGSHVAQR